MLDALVVGGGPTGLTMASELARYGLKCRIVEQLPGPSPLSRALGVQSRTLELFADFGIIDRALAQGRKATGFSLLSPGRRAHMSFKEQPWLESRYSMTLTLPQYRTEALLEERLGTFGVRLERSVTLEAFQQGAEEVTATLKNAEGQTERVSARWLIGCDGARSRVRKTLGLPFEGATYDDACVLADVAVDWPLEGSDICIMPSAHGVVGAFPMPGEPRRYRLFFVRPKDAASEAAEDMAPMSLEEIQALVDQMIPFPARVSEPQWISRYRLHARSVSRYRQGRVFLAGDAAHIHSPVGGQGMNTGIQDAYNLAWKLALVTQGHVPASMLDTYEVERHAVGRHLLEGTDRGFSFAAGGGLGARLLRTYVLPRLAGQLFRSRRMTRRASRLLSQLYVRYRHSPLSTERLWGEETGAVRMSQGPAPGDRVPEIAVKGEGMEYLHQALYGARHALLLFTGLTPGASRGQELVALAGRLEQTYGSRLQVHVVMAGASTPAPRVLADGDGAVHRRFGAGAECFYLVRPDGYVGHRERPIDPARLDAEIVRRVGR